MMFTGLVTTIRRLGARTTQKIRPRLTAALAVLAAAAAAATLFAAPASAAVAGRSAQTETTRVSVTPNDDKIYRGSYPDYWSCEYAGYIGYSNGWWGLGYFCTARPPTGIWDLYA
jgi:hypothetical protein